METLSLVVLSPSPSLAAPAPAAPSPPALARPVAVAGSSPPSLFEDPGEVVALPRLEATTAPLPALTANRTLAAADLAPAAEPPTLAGEAAAPAATAPPLDEEAEEIETPAGQRAPWTIAAGLVGLAAGLGLVLGLHAALSRRHPSPDGAPTPPATRAPAPPPAVDAAITPRRQAAPPAPPPAVAAGPEVVAPTLAQAPRPPSAGRAPRRRVPGVVLDYDPPSPKAAPVPSEPAPAGAAEAVATARQLYRHGNELLFLGDISGAIRAYQSSLRAYPGYAAGYRGLGVGWARIGDPPKAIASFEAYLKAAPDARDAPQIRERIAHLRAR